MTDVDQREQSPLRDVGPGVSRREFLKIIVGTFGAGVLSACGGEEPPTPPTVTPTSLPPTPSGPETPPPVGPELTPTPNRIEPIATATVEQEGGETESHEVDVEWTGVGGPELTDQEYNRWLDYKEDWLNLLGNNWQDNFEQGRIYVYVPVEVGENGDVVPVMHEDGDREFAGLFEIPGEEGEQSEFYFFVQREGGFQLEKIDEPNAFKEFVADWVGERARVEKTVRDVEGNEHVVFWDSNSRAWVFGEGEGELAGEEAAWFGEEGKFVLHDSFLAEPDEPQTYVNDAQVNVYLEPGGEVFAYLAEGKTFEIIGEQDGWAQIRVSGGATYWVRAGELVYHPEGEEAPPVERPYFQGRTSDRKTGEIIFHGERKAEIEPDRPYIIRTFRQFIGSPYYYRRDAIITEINSQEGIITFRLNDGSTIQRRFRKTEVIMGAHERYVGQYDYEARQGGGNFWDLEVGDAVAILNSSEAAAANPAPGLIDLEGLYIVQ